jgi:hypothetical protein
MSALAEVVELDVDLEAAPPCEAQVLDARWHYAPCENPAEYRLQLTCAKGHGSLVFLCGKCLDAVKKGSAGCSQCGDYSNFTWRMS